MYIELYGLPFDRKRRKELIERWETDRGKKEHNYIVEEIKKGAGEHLLESDFQTGRLFTIEDEYDLKGMKFSFLDLKFPSADNFKGIDFSFSEFTRCKFENATFLSVNADFCKINACEFINCNFVFFNSVGSVFRSTKFINCTFDDPNTITNCLFDNVKFERPFFRTQIFHNCKFINGTQFIEIPIYYPHNAYQNHAYDRTQLAYIFSGIKDGYKSGQERNEAIKYFLLEREYFRKYNTNSWKQKIFYLLLEKLVGHGFRPLNTFLFIILSFLILTLLQSLILGFNEDIMIYSAGSFFTFGANAEILKNASLISKILYITGSFIGIGSTALYITILVNYFFGKVP